MNAIKTFKAAVIQQSIASNNKAQNFDKAARFVRQAALQGAELIVMQELHATHYFCQRESADVFDLAESLDGPTYQAYAGLAAELDVVLVISQFERRAAGLYHNTVQVIDGLKGRAGIFRKMHIPDDPGFYEKYYFTPGDGNGTCNGFAPIETRLGKLGVLICWDQWYPEAARLMALAGANMLIYPTAIGWIPLQAADENARQLDAWITIQRSHAIANGIPTLVANRTGYEADPEAKGGIEFWGNSFIVGPQGEFLAQADVVSEGVFMAEVNLSRTETVRRLWPYLRDRRIDAYQGLTSRWLADN